MPVDSYHRHCRLRRRYCAAWRWRQSRLQDQRRRRQRTGHNASSQSSFSAWPSFGLACKLPQHGKGNVISQRETRGRRKGKRDKRPRKKYRKEGYVNYLCLRNANKLWTKWHAYPAESKDEARPRSLVLFVREEAIAREAMRDEGEHQNNKKGRGRKIKLKNRGKKKKRRKERNRES